MPRVKRSLSLRDFHKAYSLRCKEKGVKPKPYVEYKKTLLEMGVVMREILLQNGIIALPWKHGDIFFKKNERRAIMDMKATREMGVPVLEFNEHTDGYPYSLFWLSPERIQKKRRLWCFSKGRHIRDLSAKLFKSKGVTFPDYGQLQSSVKEQ